MLAIRPDRLLRGVGGVKCTEDSPFGYV